MKAAILFKPNEPLQVLDCELDPPKAGEVRVKMKAAGAWREHLDSSSVPYPNPPEPARTNASPPPELT